MNTLKASIRSSLFLLCGAVIQVSASPAAPAAPQTPAAPLTGTLFNSAAERAKIEAGLRRSKFTAQQAAAEDEPNLIHGWIRRGDGDTTVWVDGRMIGPLGAPLAAKVAAGSVGSPSGATILIREQVTVRSESPATTRARPRSKRHKTTRAP